MTVSTDKQRQFTIPDINSPIATFLIFNTTVRNDYSINGTTLDTLFDVPLGSQLTLIVISLDYTFSDRFHYCIIYSIYDFNLTSFSCLI